MAGSSRWDPALYEAQHAFVWQFGRGVLDLLAAQRGERILDLGCGTGQLTAEIAGTGADVLGLDSSAEMIAQARQNYPAKQQRGLSFTLADGAAMTFQSEFDAIFSNAALHWMLDTAAVARAVAAALKPGGRFVFECGGKGNIELINQAITAVYDDVLGRPSPPSRTVFHSIGSMSAVLENNGFEILQAELFDRPTPLEGTDGMERWLEQFAAWQFEGLSSSERVAALRAVVERLRPKLFHDGLWTADYCRLRIVARRLS